MRKPTRSDTEKQILAAANELLERHGAKAITARAVCEIVKVKQPTLYYHFGSKDGLIRAMILDGMSDFIEEKRAVSKVADPIEGLYLGWDAFIDYFYHRPELFNLIHKTVGACPVTMGEAVESARSRFTKLEKKGRLVMSVEIAICCLLGVANGVLALRTQGRSQDEIKKCGRIMFDGLMMRIVRDFDPRDEPSSLELEAAYPERADAFGL